MGFLYSPNDEFEITCPECLETILTSITTLEIDNQLTCPECENQFKVDVELMKEKSELLFRKIVGTMPKNPSHN